MFLGFRDSDAVRSAASGDHQSAFECKIVALGSRLSGLGGLSFEETIRLKLAPKPYMLKSMPQPPALTPGPLKPKRVLDKCLHLHVTLTSRHRPYMH